MKTCCSARDSESFRNLRQIMGINYKTIFAGKESEPTVFQPIHRFWRTMGMPEAFYQCERTARGGSGQGYNCVTRAFQGSFAIGIRRRACPHKSEALSIVSGDWIERIFDHVVTMVRPKQDHITRLRICPDPGGCCKNLSILPEKVQAYSNCRKNYQNHGGNCCCETISNNVLGR